MPPSPILITGAGSGIGEATALLAAERGISLILCDLQQTVIDSVASRAEAAGSPAAVGFIADVRDASQVKDVFDHGTDAVGPPNAVVCCAGIDQGAPSHEMPEQNFDRIIDVNLKGTFLAVRELTGRLLEAGECGSVVCISSIAATIGLPESAAYCASKGAVAAMVRAMAVEYAGHGIRINALAPGATETPLMWANVANAEFEQVKDEVDAVVPMGRLANPREQAQAALWLLSNQASYVTGSELVVDGGVLATSILPA